jgi:hypothetical protein
MAAISLMLLEYMYSCVKFSGLELKAYIIGLYFKIKYNLMHPKVILFEILLCEIRSDYKHET